MPSIYKLYPNRLAITITASGNMREIISDIRIKIPVYINSNQKSIETKAIWDTGATNSVIDTELAKLIGLIPTGKATTIGVHGQQIVDTYTVDIQIVNTININSIPISSGKLNVTQNIGFLIGMDIINIGDFSYTSDKNNRVFTFRVPTMPIPIDFVKDINNFKATEAKHNANKKKVKKFHNHG